MNYPVLLNTKCEHLPRVTAAVKIVNHLQNFFRLKIVEATWLPHDEDEERQVDSDKILALVWKRFKQKPVIVVLHNPFDDNYFSQEYRECYMITMADWEASFAPPPLGVYLAYQFAGAFINFAPDLSTEMMDEWAHDPPIGCVFDYFLEKDLIKLGMVGANLCGDCEVKLSGMGLSDLALKSIEEILLYVRGATIRRPRSTPSKVFIGHGRSSAWHELEAFLTKDLGLEVEEFNQSSAAGIATTERLEEMMRRSCFAFLVMTGEDRHIDKKLHARENVVHEIGLFQGSLGFRKAIVLKETSVPEFSNIHGLTYISFPKTGLNKEARDKIFQTLVREGIVDTAQQRLIHKQ